MTRLARVVFGAQRHSSIISRAARPARLCVPVIQRPARTPSGRIWNPRRETRCLQSEVVSLQRGARPFPLISGRRAITVGTACACLLVGAGMGSATAGEGTALSQTINAQFLGATGVQNVTAVQFLGKEDGWFGVDEQSPSSASPLPGTSSLMHTTDGGTAWTRVAAAPGPILSLDLLSPQRGFLLVGSGKSLTLMAVSAGGSTLRVVSHPPGGGIAPELHFSSSTDGFLVSGTTLDVTEDGGVTWTSSRMTLPSSPSRDAGSAPSVPYLLTARFGFIAKAGTIFRTTDGGQSWQKVYSLPLGLAPMGGNLAAGPVTFVTSALGYAVLNIPNCWAGGCPDVIVRTEDGGASWRAVSGEMQGPLPGLDAPHTGPPGGISEILGWRSGDVIAATMLGISISRNGGATWASVTPPSLSTPSMFRVFTYARGRGAGRWRTVPHAAHA